MKTAFRSTLAVAVFGAAQLASGAEDCVALAASVESAVKSGPDNVLSIVEAEMGAYPGCGCEVVKSAIRAAEADAAEVAAIVETAASIAPDQMRLIAQCAVAVAPDSLGEVQKVLARLEPGQGEGYSGKSTKAVDPPLEVLPAWNPLDFPGQLPGTPPGTGVTVPGGPGGPGGLIFFPPGLPPFTTPVVQLPPVVDPPPSTPVNP